MIDHLRLWLDDTPRGGPENMAVDQWLLAGADEPVLRVYRWQAGWGSFGYFVPLAEARQALPGSALVRRWTGGGIVDHTCDWTYTLVVPRGIPLAEARGAESYAVIHGALGRALREAGVDARLSGPAAPGRGGVCFVHAVEHDLVDSRGRKLAGAGQRRTTRGLLHQGSVAVPGDGERGRCLARSLARSVTEAPLLPQPPDIDNILTGRYAPREWQQRR